VGPKVSGIAVHTGARIAPTLEEYANQPREQRLQRLTSTADELATAIEGQSDAVLSCRPDAQSWAAKGSPLPSAGYRGKPSAS
jgi:hypothetical protein